MYILSVNSVCIKSVYPYTSLGYDTVFKNKKKLALLTFKKDYTGIEKAARSGYKTTKGREFTLQKYFEQILNFECFLKLWFT